MRTNNPGIWGQAGVGLPKAPVYDLIYNRADDILVVGTLGRGAWILRGISIAPQFQVPGSLDFENTCVGSTRTATLNVCNTGNANLVVSSITSSDPQFAVTTPSGNFPVIISPDFCFPFQVGFTPTDVSAKFATLTISSNDPANPSLTVQARGNGGQQDIRVTGSTDFGNICSETHPERTVSMCNVGACNLVVTGATFVPGCPDFSLINNPFPATVSPDSCLNLTIRYIGIRTGPKSCDLVATSNDPKRRALQVQ